MPTAAENTNPPTIAAGTIGAGQPATSERNFDRPTPMTMPAIPPVTLSSTASARNCSSTCSRRAPIAMRRPISRVRSVTDTSRMFMMPMPPTTREIEATAANSSAMIRLLVSAVSAIWLKLRTEKSFGSPARTRCLRVRISVAWAIAGCTCAALAACT